VTRSPRHFAVQNESYKPSFQNRLPPRQRLQCRRRRCSERAAGEEEEEDAAAVDGTLEDHWYFSSGSVRGWRVGVVLSVVVPERGAGGCLRSLRLKYKRGDSSPHGPDR